MFASRIAFRSLLVAAALFTVACGDLPTSPDPQSEAARVAPTSSLLDVAGDQQVAVLHRLTPLAEDEVVTRTIGMFGGVIHLPNAGFALLVPPFAVSSPTTITVVAPAGDLVGYHFFPEGLVFRAPLLAVQNVLRTNALEVLSQGGHLTAAYVQEEFSPTMEALELIPFDANGSLGSFPIRHFSGYVIAED